MKFVLAVLIFLSSFMTSAYAEDSEVLNLSLEKKTTYTYPKKVLTAYFIGRDLGDIILRDDGTLQLLIKGNTKVQVLNSDGSITTLNIASYSAEEGRKVKRTKDGYFFQYKYTLIDRDYVEEFHPDAQFWSHDFLLTTRVGNEDNITAKYRTQISRNDSYYFQYNYEPRWYLGYGDYNFIFNDFRLPRLGLPVLRQGLLGYDHGDLMFEAWSGSKSPIYYNKNQEMPEQDKLYGFRTNYSVTPTLDLFFSNATNNEKDVSLNYLGFRKTINKYHSLMGTYGGTDERQAWAWRYQYRHTTDNWSLQRFYLSHEYMGEGIDSIDSFTTNPYERIQARADFYSPVKGHEGSIFFSPGARYVLDGYDQSYEGTARLGWKNKRVRVFNDIRHVERHNDTMGGFRSETNGYRPGITVFVIDDREEKLGLTFTQSSQTTHQKASNIKYSTEASEIASDYRKGRFTNNTFIGRNTYDNVSGDEVAGYSYGTRFNWRTERYSFFVSGRWQYLDQNFVDTPTSDYELSRRVLGAGVNARLNRNHSVTAGYQNIRHTQRDVDILRFIYTFEMGDDNRSVSESIMPSSVTASVYLDKNYNGIQDEGEQTIEGLAFNLGGKNSTEVLTGGSVEFKRLERKMYTLSVDAPDYVLDQNYIALDMQQSYSSKKLSIAAYPKKTVTVSLKAPAGLTIASKVVCGPKIIMAPLRTGSVFIDIPSDRDCILSMDSSSATGSLALSDNDFVLKDKNEVTVTKNKAITGYVYRDKNRNGVMDSGEGISLNFTLGKYSLKSTSSGFFDLDPQSLNEEMTFKQEGCQLTPRSNYFRDVITQGRAVLIRCR